MNAAVHELETLLHDQPLTPLRPEQREEYERELTRLGAMAQGRDMDGRATTFVPSDRGGSTQAARRVQKILHDQSPRRVEEPLRRDRIARLTQQVIDEVVRPAMLPQSVMARNPAGAVGAFMKGENSRPVKHAILTVKRALFALEPDTTDEDHANMERYRPTGQRADGTSTFMVDAQLPGVFAMTPQAKERWPLAEPQGTALAQVRQAEAAVQPKPAKPVTPAKKRPEQQWSESQRKAWGEKMRAARLLKLQTVPVQDLSGVIGAGQ